MSAGARSFVVYAEPEAEPSVAVDPPAPSQDFDTLAPSQVSQAVENGHHQSRQVSQAADEMWRKQ